MVSLVEFINNYALMIVFHIKLTLINPDSSLSICSYISSVFNTIFESNLLVILIKVIRF